MNARVCPCGAGIGPHNKSGLCKPCVCRRNALDPELNARRRAGCVRAWENNPKRRQETSKRVREYLRTHPEEIEARRAFGKANFARTIQSPQAIARRNNPDGMARMRAKLSARRLSGIPPRWLDEYRKLMLRHRMTRAKALDLLANRERERIAAMSPFERQLHALQNGARLVEMPAKGAFGR